MNQDKKPLVSFSMSAYNTEAYVGEAIQSLLNQTNPNWYLCLFNNGSTDRTGEICRKYAEQDDRIYYYSCKENNKLTPEEKIAYDYACEVEDTLGAEYFAMLDSDDRYHPAFIDQMAEVARETDADIVICGTTAFWDGTVQKKVTVPPDLVIDKSHALTEQGFQSLYGSLRQYWAKLYRAKTCLSVSRKIFWNTPNFLTSGSDTYFVLNMLLSVQKVASISRPLHFYRIRQNSSHFSSCVDPRRIQEGGCLYDLGLRLAEKYRVHTPKTEQFLNVMYYQHLAMLLHQTVLSPKMAVQEKRAFIQKIFLDADFQKHLRENETVALCHLARALEGIPGQDILFLEDVYEARLLRSISLEQAKIINPALFLSGVYAPENLNRWGLYSLQLHIRLAPLYTEKCLAGNVPDKVNKPQSEKHIEAKQEALLYIDQKRYPEALSLLEGLLEERPLDREGLYLKMYAGFASGDMVLALETYSIAYIFYAADEELMELGRQIYDNSLR